MAARRRRAARLARWAALIAAAVAGTSSFSRLPPGLTGRYYGVLAVAVTYIVVRKVVQRIAMEVLP